MQARLLKNEMSRNVIAEYSGIKHPNRSVIISGHIDSWDVGQGAVDDGGGAFISWMALRVLKTFCPPARRSVRYLDKTFILSFPK